MNGYRRLAAAAFLSVGAAMVTAPARTVARSPRALPLAERLLPLQGPDGRLLYLKNCRTCHGATGTPSGENRAKYPKIRTLSDSAFQAGISDDSLLTVLKKGKGRDMKSWSDALTTEEMKAVILYVRTLPSKRR